MNARRSLQTLASILFVTLATLGAPTQAADLQLTFETDRVIAEGLSPGTDAVFFAVTHGRMGWDHVIRRVDRVITDDDRDGVVELIWDRGNLPFQSVWVVIDSRNGQYTSAVPPGMTNRDVGISIDELIRDGNSVTGVVQNKRNYVEVLLSHPGFGVWGLTTGDGGPNDADGQADGQIQIDFDRMRPLDDSSPAPHVIPNGGIVAIIDGLTLEFGVCRVSGGPANNQAMTLPTTGEEVGR